MSAGDKVFAGSIPENYDRYMVPLIFESYARDMARRAAALSPKAVLETAAGSGVVTRALAPVLSPDARYVVTDLNQPMLDYAATRQEPTAASAGAQADAQGAAVRRCRLRSGLLPVRRHVLPRPPKALPRGPTGAQAGRTFPVQRLGPDRGERIRRRRDERARGSFSRTIRRASWRARRTAITTPR